MHLKTLLFAAATLFLIQSCQTDAIQDENPPAPGFNIEASDHHAIILADKVMQALGGRKAWDATRYLKWNFFGRRILTWDKHTGDVRIESLPDSTTYLLNVNTMEGKVRRRGVVETNPDTLNMLLDRGKSIWINDSYWLVMPFKLKDSGVTLKHVGQDTTADGRLADVLQLTFDQVGDTPENKYLVYVDDETKLVTQWAFFRDAGMESPNFVTPWANYKKYGNILLSGDRGERQLSDIEVPESLPADIFTEF